MPKFQNNKNIITLSSSFLLIGYWLSNILNKRLNWKKKIYIFQKLIFLDNFSYKISCHWQIEGLFPKSLVANKMAI